MLCYNKKWLYVLANASLVCVDGALPLPWKFDEMTKLWDLEFVNASTKVVVFQPHKQLQQIGLMHNSPQLPWKQNDGEFSLQTNHINTKLQSHIMHIFAIFLPSSKLWYGMCPLTQVWTSYKTNLNFEFLFNFHSQTNSKFNGSHTVKHHRIFSFIYFVPLLGWKNLVCWCHNDVVKTQFGRYSPTCQNNFQIHVDDTH